MICGMWKGVKAVSYHGRARSHCSSTTETNASGATERGIVKSNVVVVFIVVGLMRHNLCESLSGGFGGGVLRSPNIRHGRTSGPCTRMAVQRRHHHRRVWRRRRPRWALLPIVGSPPIHLQNHKKIEKINIKGKKSDLISSFVMDNLYLVILAVLCNWYCIVFSWLVYLLLKRNWKNAENLVTEFMDIFGRN